MIKVNKFYISAIISSFIFAYLEGGNLPYAIFYTLIIPFIVSFVFIFLNSKRVVVKIKADKNTFTRKEQGEITEIIINNGNLPVPYIYYINKSIQEIDKNYKGSLLSLNADGSRWNRTRLKFIRRGKYNIGSFSLEYRDFFNIIKYKKDMKKDISIYVYPEVFKISELDCGGKDIYKENFSIDSRNSDIHKYKDIRKYQVGESLRKIHWKITAKKGELYSKNNDNVSVNDVVIILDMNVKNNYMDASKDMEEELISYFLSVVNFFIIEGIRVRVLINNDKGLDYILRDSVDFDMLLDYFLENKSQGTKYIIDFIKDNNEFYQNENWIGIFSLESDNVFINDLKDISGKFNLFFLSEACGISFIKQAEKESINCINCESLLLKE